MNAQALATRNPLSTGMVVSILVHVFGVAWILFELARPQPLVSPVDLANAVPISMEMFKPPSPPKVEPKPQTPKEIVTTKAPDPDVQVEEAPVDPAPAEPQPSPAQAAPGTPSYASLVAGIIQRNKRYPRDALRDGIEGVVGVYFVINRQGTVIGYRIEESSGQRILDDEIVRMLKRVRFPPIPQDDGGDPERREFSLPIRFRIAEG